MTDADDTPPPPAAPARPARTRAHSAAQLRAALGLSEDQFRRARVTGVIPGPNLKTPRWSGPLVDELVEVRDYITTRIPDDLSEDQLREALGLPWADWLQARKAGTVPDPDRDIYWTRRLADDLVARAEEIKAATPPPPLGANRCAELLAELLQVEVSRWDVIALAEAGHVDVVGHHGKEHWPLYDVGQLQRLAADDQTRRLVLDMIADRLAWNAGSVDRFEGAELFGWRVTDFVAFTEAQGLTPGRFGRWSRTDLAALTADADLMEATRRDHLLGPQQAADHLDVRRRDFDYAVAAGWITPVTTWEREVGKRRVIEVPMYRTGDVEDLREQPGVDWEAVRNTPPGQPSPLREFTRLPISRAAAVRAFCADLGAAWTVEVWPHYNQRGDRWEIDWEIRADGRPTEQGVETALRAHPGARHHLDAIHLSTEVGEVIRWARRMLEPGVAVVVDTETTDLDGTVIEIAVIDAATGDTLLDTLVHPDGVPIAEGARAVHGISDRALRSAPRWADVAPRFLEVVAGRHILAYNADFDLQAIGRTHQHADLDAADLPYSAHWGCLMGARSIWARTGMWLPLGGSHRALGDARAARQVLQAMAAPLR